jgi:endonuclease/exonuclease/phosphatase family metal-dependent hydrolase
MSDTIKPLTAIELEIAELVGRGLRVKQVHLSLKERGRHMAISTLNTRIRDVAYKLPNPLGLPPMAIIRLWWCTKKAA